MTHPILATPRSGYGGRGYRIPGYDIVFPSVTTVLKKTAKEGLHQWIADQTAAYAVAHLSDLRGLEDDVIMGRLRWVWSSAKAGEDSRYYHERVRDDHAEMGTEVHEYGEVALRGGEYPVLRTREAQEAAEALMDWLMDHEVEPILTEATVVNTKSDRPYAGTLDAVWRVLCLHDGPSCTGSDEPVVCLIDLKTSRHTWPEHWMQLSALEQADVLMVQVEEGTEGAGKAVKTEAGKKITTWWTEAEVPIYDRTAVLHIRPDDLDEKGNLIPRYARLIVSQDRDLDYEAFDGALRMVYAEHKKKLRAKARTEGTEI